MQEHRDDFMALRPRDLGLPRSSRAELADRLFDALHAITRGRHGARVWQLYDEGMNPRTRRLPLSALLGARSS